MKGIKMQDHSHENNIDKFPVAIAYVPWQRFDNMYDDLEKAYCTSPIVPDLRSPYERMRCE